MGKSGFWRDEPTVISARRKGIKNMKRKKHRQTQGMKKETYNSKLGIPEGNWREDNTVQHHRDRNCKK